MGAPAHKAPQTRTAIRRRNRIQRRIALLLLAALMGAGGASAMFAHPASVDAKPFDTAHAVTRTMLEQPVAASRGTTREPLDTESTGNEGEWKLDDSTGTLGKLTAIPADNPVVKALVNGRDEGRTPEGFDPNHATGDTGNAYEYSQCTWWAYVRRHQLGLPAGSHMGNGADWASTARRLGYWVDNTPRVGDVICFQRGQYESDSTYGHVAIVENVGEDGSVTTSECGSVCNGKPYSRTFTAAQAKTLQYIHY